MDLLRRLAVLLVELLAVLLLLPLGALAADMQVNGISLEPCPMEDVGAQPQLTRPLGASCFALRGTVINTTKKPVIDTDLFARILDASGEPVLQNRSRVGSIGDVPPGSSPFALRLSIPAGTPGPFQVSMARARGFSAAVRKRAADTDEQLPLEQGLLE
jgi:hypothetical protein